MLPDDQLRRTRAAVLVQRKPVQLLASGIGRPDIDGAHVGREEVRVRITVPVWEKLTARVAGAIVQQQPLAIALEARAALTLIGDVSAIG